MSQRKQRTHVEGLLDTWEGQMDGEGIGSLLEVRLVEDDSQEEKEEETEVGVFGKREVDKKRTVSEIDLVKEEKIGEVDSEIYGEDEVNNDVYGEGEVQNDTSWKGEVNNDVYGGKEVTNNTSWKGEVNRDVCEVNIGIYGEEEVNHTVYMEGEVNVKIEKEELDHVDSDFYIKDIDVTQVDEVDGFNTNTKTQQEPGTSLLEEWPLITEIKVEPTTSDARATNITENDSMSPNTSFSLEIEVRPHKCKLCIKSFKNIRNLKRHQLSHSGERTLFECDFCSQRFTAKFSMARHLLSHLGKKPKTSKKKFFCEFCPKQSTKKQLMQFHMLQHMGKTLPNQCKMCYKAFALEKDLRLHELFHSGEKPFECLKCNKRYQRKGDLQKHERIMHSSIPSSKHYCTICSKVFENLKRHSAVHNGKPHICPYCSKAFSFQDTLEYHIFSNHSPGNSSTENSVPSIQNFSCQICSQTFSNKRFLQKHAETHVDKFNCDFCSKWFLSKKGLEKHVTKYHLIENLNFKSAKHQCNVCGKVFPYKTELRRHSFTHNGLKPHQCIHCSQSFSQRSSLKRHVFTIHLKSN